MFDVEGHLLAFSLWFMAQKEGRFNSKEVEHYKVLS